MNTDNKLAQALRKLVSGWQWSADNAATNGDNSGSALLRICAQQAENLLAAHDAREGESVTRCIDCHEPGAAVCEACAQLRCESVLAAQPQPSVADGWVETVKARAAAVLCESGSLCGYPESHCHAREGAVALYEAGLLAAAPQPAQGDRT